MNTTFLKIKFQTLLLKSCNREVAMFMLRSKDMIWHEKQLPKRLAAGKAPALLHNWLFYHIIASGRVIPTTVKAGRTVTQSCVAVMSRTAGAFNPFGKRERERKKSH